MLLVETRSLTSSLFTLLFNEFFNYRNKHDFYLLTKQQVHKVMHLKQTTANFVNNHHKSMNLKES